MNPVKAHLGPFLEDAFGDAIRRNLLAVVYGGADEDAYLAQHTGIDEIHLTGTDRTYDHLVWGPPGPERNARKTRNAPLLSKPVTAELRGGDVQLAETIRAGRIRLEGPPTLVRAFPAWLTLSAFAGVERVGAAVPARPA